MFNRHKSGFFRILAAIISLAVFLLVLVSHTSANILFNRTVVISTAVPSAPATHSFSFDIPSTSVIGSIVFEYCANSSIFYYTCTVPPGMDATGAALTSQTGNTGFSIDSADTTANKIVLTRPPIAGTITSNSYIFNNIINPSTSGQVIFVRMSTHSAADGSGPWQDKGAVGFATQTIFNVDAYVPPFLRLCVAITVAPDCATMAGDSIDLGILSSKHVSYGQSQFATATNDPNGYVINALGNTMTSGNNTITAIPAPAASFPGTGQFGMNLRANLIPPVGQDPVGLGTALPAPDYNIPNKFVFNSGDTITSSSLSTNYNRMTVSYIVNIPSNQPGGVYATTVTYVATVQF